MPELGRAALVATLGLAVYAVVAGVVRRLEGPPPARALRPERAHRRLRRRASSPRSSSSRRSIRHDFSFVYVAEHTSRELPHRLHDLGVLGRAGGLAAALAAGPDRLLDRRPAREPAHRPRPRRLGRRPCSAASRVFFAFLLVVVASPFATQAAPADGAGLNPSLQNPYMMAHPPLLYLGYVGLTIPFAFAMGALLARRTDERWIVATRRWTLVAWTCLGVGQLLGSHWAYEEVGWGGYYAWDPVENAALMPWLAATAFLHSVMIQEKRGMLQRLEHAARGAGVRALALRDVPDPLRRSSARSTRSRRARSGRGSSASSASSSSARSRSSSPGCRCCARRRGSSRSSRARRRSSTTTCCSSR